MKRSFSAAIALATIALAGAHCSDGFPTRRSEAHLVVAITGGPTGTPNERQPLRFDVATPYTVSLTAQRPDGSVDTSFNGYVRISVEPGTVASVTGATVDGRNVRLVNGVAEGVTVSLVAAYGDTRIWAEDLGYVPADPGKPPQCADGIDNNGNGLIDAKADPGCAFPNDDDENGGTFVAGTSDTIYFVRPRVADVRGVDHGGTGTSFPHEQVQIDTGYRDEAYTFSTVVTRVAPDGFYVTDLADLDTSKGGRAFASVFAFNFSAPPGMRVCDRLKSFSGTVSDFHGFTEVNYPTWTLEPWDPTARPCLVPEPRVLAALDLDPKGSTLRQMTSGFVRLLTQGNASVHISKHFGPKHPAGPPFVFTDDASNCDINGDGKVDFYTEPEKSCSSSCAADPECTEFSSYSSRNAFRLVVSDATGTGTVFADASQAAPYDPVVHRGATLKSFSGTVRFFDGGGGQYTIEARCSDDLVTDVNAQPIASDIACVHARTSIDVNAGSN